MPLPLLQNNWDRIIINFNSDQQGSAKSRFHGISVIVDGLTKIAMYLPGQNHINPEEIAGRSFKYAICRNVLPHNVVIDCRTQLPSQISTWVYCDRTNDHVLSTSFHLQTHGQPERQIQIVEWYLRAFSNSNQDNWATLLPVAEFT